MSVEEVRQRAKEVRAGEHAGTGTSLSTGNWRQKTEFENEIKPQRSAQRGRKPAECRTEAPSWMNQLVRKQEGRFWGGFSDTVGFPEVLRERLRPGCRWRGVIL